MAGIAHSSNAYYSRRVQHTAGNPILTLCNTHKTKWHTQLSNISSSQAVSCRCCMGLLSAMHACMQATQIADQAEASLGEAGHTCVYAVQSSIGGRVPEADAAISCSTTRCKQAVLMGRPCNGLHSCVVVAELDDRRCGVQVPDVQLVVIATTGNLSIIRRPFKPHTWSHIAHMGQHHVHSASLSQLV